MLSVTSGLHLSKWLCHNIQRCLSLCGDNLTTADPVLWHYDATKPVTTQSDESEGGPGCSQLLKGHLTAPASSALPWTKLCSKQVWAFFRHFTITCTSGGRLRLKQTTSHWLQHSISPSSVHPSSSTACYTHCWIRVLMSFTGQKLHTAPRKSTDVQTQYV